MRVLITNDDGIAAKGLQELRRALVAVPDLEVNVVAPDSNRSATARSITTRSPLWVEEIGFDDGGNGYACDGTPVDCVRFAELGLIGERPELIVSGINHGANLGDDITYSGTVAAALEGIVLGIPAIAISQQSGRREMDFRLGRELRLLGRGGVRCPAGRAGRARAASRRHPAQRQLPRRRRRAGSRSPTSASASTTTS